VQQWNAESYARNAAFVPALGAGVLEQLAPQPGERILDVGCGDGALTARIIDAGARVVGVDSSPEFVAAARARGIDARLADAQALEFAREFDAAFSNAALHWMPDPARVLEGVSRALLPGGRFVGEFGGMGNVAAIVTAIRAVLERHGLGAPRRNPWYFPTVAEYRTRLRTAGFEVERIELFGRQTPLPAGMRVWLETFANPFFGGVRDAECDPLLDEITELLAPSLRDGGGNWVADYMRLRFTARTLPVR